MASRCVLLYSVAGGLINLECRERRCLSHSLYIAVNDDDDEERPLLPVRRGAEEVTEK